MNWGTIVLTILGSGSLSAFVSYFLNRRFNNKKLNAEIVSKSRIDWINEFRSIASDYLYEGYKSIEEGKLFCEFEKLMNNSKPYSNSKSRYKKKSEYHAKKYNETVNNMTKYFIQIRLYLPDRPDGSSQEEHKKIKDEIKALGNKLNNAMGNRDKKYFNQIQKVDMQFLADYIAEYLKKEWDKAKDKK
ncbi:hypothetical protein [Staphylococcus epidermidis]|uniref:hypothetical protein n=1 Tax=Staphylococcus epidermidis TaxID=1282 RepID=UPI001E328CA1|nr:hypothetical protein [Staphylococcus epidermidis]MCD8924763.1 hypothetical protein [Staphylococcus epidermidis]